MFEISSFLLLKKYIQRKPYIFVIWYIISKTHIYVAVVDRTNEQSKSKYFYSVFPHKKGISGPAILVVSSYRLIQ